MTTAVSSFEEIAQRLDKAMEGLSRSMDLAGRLVVEIVDAFPDASERLQRRSPNVPPRFWKMLEKVGRGVLDGRVALGCPHSFQLQRLPLSEQRKALDETLVLALPDGDTCKIRLQDATPEQARQLLGEQGVRSVEQQAQWVRTHETKTAPRAQRAMISYEPNVKRGELRIIARGPGELIFKKSELIDLLRRLEK
jgi:hypothetical protein